MDVINKPWGYELIWAKNEHYVGKILHVNAGQRLSLQLHKEKHETLLCLRGSAAVTTFIKNELLKTTTLLSETDDIEKRVIVIEPLTIHRIEAITDTDILEVSTSHLDDVIRLHDDYQRT